MLNIRKAELDDVDMLLDMKLDIILSSEEIAELDKRELEKIVNYSEEEIRENLEDYKIIEDNDKNIIGIFALFDYDDGKLLDTIYVINSSRKKGIGTKIIKNIILNNYQPIYLWVYKSNKLAVKLYERLNFKIKEETDTRYFMKNENIKPDNNLIKARAFCSEVEKISKKYNLEYFFVTEGASSTKVENCGAVRNARNNHIEWEKENGYNPNEDWSKKITTLW